MPALIRSLRVAYIALVLAGCSLAGPRPLGTPVPGTAPAEPARAAPAATPVRADSRAASVTADAADTSGAHAEPPARLATSPPSVEPPLAPPPIAREFRAAWISPVWSGEWPRPGLEPEAQRRLLIELLDRARAVGLNAVVLHVRPAADAIYPSARAPWSAYLTGTLGKAPEPFWDPLAFAVTEAHRRGLELHAWFNPFRAAPPDLRVDVAAADARHVVRYGKQPWIDPGVPDARRRALDDILEVVDRYDIDGVHLDDYFYPYRQEREVTRRVRSGGRTRTVTRTENIPFPDDASWERYGRSFERRADWRRSNIDDFVATLYREVKARRPWVAVGISPFGIWRPGSPAGITGLDAYAEIYADARRWLHEGWVDYLAPQLYWEIDGTQSRFTRLDAWWREENVRGRHLWPGLFTEREIAARSAWPAGEIRRQVESLRTARRGSTESLGHIHFRMSALRPLGDRLRARLYAEPALPPASPWLDDRVPAAPIARAIPLEDTTRGVLLSVAPGDSVPVRWWVVQLLEGEDEWRTLVRSAEAGAVRLPPGTAPRAIVVRAVSRTGIESEPTSLRLP